MCFSMVFSSMYIIHFAMFALFNHPSYPYPNPSPASDIFPLPQCFHFHFLKACI